MIRIKIWKMYERVIENIMLERDNENIVKPNISFCQPFLLLDQVK